MPEDARFEPLDPSGRMALLRARRSALRGTIAFALAAGVGAVAILGSLLGGDALGVFPLVALLCAGWTWLLRRMPPMAAGHVTRPARRAGPTALWLGRPAPAPQQRTVRHHASGAPAGRSWPRAVARARRLLREGMPVHAHLAPRAGSPSVAQAGVEQVASAQAAVDIARATKKAHPPSNRLLRADRCGSTDKASCPETLPGVGNGAHLNSQLYAKLGVARRTEAVARAHAIGLLTDVRD